MSRSSAANRNAAASQMTRDMGAAEASLSFGIAAFQFGFSLGYAIGLAFWQGSGADSQETYMRMTRTAVTGYRSIYGRTLGEKYSYTPNFRDGQRLSVVRLESVGGQISGSSRCAAVLW